MSRAAEQAASAEDESLDAAADEADASEETTEETACCKISNALWKTTCKHMFATLLTLKKWENLHPGHDI